MNVLVVNCGSSSLKFQLINYDNRDVMAKGICERIGIDGRLVYEPKGGEKEVTDAAMPDHTTAIQMVLDALVNEKSGVISSLNEIDAIGHRVLHGGMKITNSVIIDEEVIKVIEECADLGPLHNPANLMGINACMKLMPGVPNVAVFDTAFHQTMPPKAYMYGIPKEYYEKYAIRKYGFHGTSHKYVSKRTADFLGKDIKDLKIIVCHMGNGASLSAVKDGKCVDTSMGLTPLEGVIMGTRSGDIDPAFVEYLCNKENLSVSEVLNILNKKSGMLGMTGISSDYRDVSAAAEEGNQDAINCLEAYAYRIIKYIGSYIAAMGGVDVITFTAGLGENAIPLRKTICEAFGYMGLVFDDEANNCRGKEMIITKPESKVMACVIPTNEEIAICEETVELVQKNLDK